MNTELQKLIHSECIQAMESIIKLYKCGDVHMVILQTYNNSLFT